MISAEEYFKKEYGEGHIKRAIELNDLQSIYALMEEFADNTMQVKNNDLLHDVSHCGLTEEEQEERRDLMMLRADSTRFFHQCELDRLNEINDKMFKNSKKPHCG